jgi:hypothetical protein
MASFNSEGSLQLDPARLLPSRQSATNLKDILVYSFNRLRRNRLNILAIPFACVLFLWLIPLSPPLPPSYKKEWTEERWLPQMAHEGTMESKAEGKFVKLVWGVMVVVECRTLRSDHILVSS